jgi:hypothetical protein
MREGLGGSDTAESAMRDMAEQLQRKIAEIDDPSRRAEVEAGGTVELISDLAKDLRKSDLSPDAINLRLDKIQMELSKLVASRQTTITQAAALPVVNDEPNLIFVIMPFAQAHIDTYEAIRRGVARVSIDLRVTRADEVPGAVQVTDEIKRLIRMAGLVLCDLTEERQNVYYELGLANGLGKRIICIARRNTPIHFDVYGLKILFFDTYYQLEARLEEEVRALLNL